MAHDAGLGLRCDNRWRSGDSRGCYNRRNNYWLFSNRCFNHWLFSNRCFSPGRFNNRCFSHWRFDIRWFNYWLFSNRCFNHWLFSNWCFNNRRFRHRWFCGFHHRLSNHFILRSNKLRLLSHRRGNNFRMCGLHLNRLWFGNRRFRFNDYRRLLFHDGNRLLGCFRGHLLYFSNQRGSFRCRFGVGFILLLNHRRILLQLVLRTGDRITDPHLT